MTKPTCLSWSYKDLIIFLHLSQNYYVLIYVSSGAKTPTSAAES